MSIIKEVKRANKRYSLFSEGDKILIAYSGGMDSSALLAVLMELKEEYSLELFLGHFNHKLRKEAEEDEKFVKNTAQKFSLPIFIGSEDVRSYAAKHKLNLEEAGRLLRYKFLKKTASEIGGAKIATGHTASDQAETFLMRIMRGSGLRGLTGILPVVEEIIIRPLILVEREPIEAYLHEKQMPFRIDESNFDRRYLRNKIRSDLLPVIEKDFEPRIVSHISRTVEVLQEDESLLEDLSKTYSERAVEEKENKFQLDVRSLADLPLGMRRRVVREFLKKLKGDLRGVDFEDVDLVLRLQEGKELHLKRDLFLKRHGRWISLKEEKKPDISYNVMWDGKDPLEITEIGLVFKGRKKKTGRYQDIRSDDRTEALLDFHKIQFPLKVRSRNEGDRYLPCGAPGRKKVKEIMREKKIPPQERDRYPVFLSGEEIVWILGLPVSENCKVTEETEVIFWIAVGEKNSS
jgi:tRNA(Ile)-lysidine synthase